MVLGFLRDRRFLPAVPVAMLNRTRSSVLLRPLVASRLSDIIEPFLTTPAAPGVTECFPVTIHTFVSVCQSQGIKAIPGNTASICTSFSTRERHKDLIFAPLGVGCLQDFSLQAWQLLIFPSLMRKPSLLLSTQESVFHEQSSPGTKVNGPPAFPWGPKSEFLNCSRILCTTRRHCPALMRDFSREGNINRSSYYWIPVEVLRNVQSGLF